MVSLGLIGGGGEVRPQPLTSTGFPSLVLEDVLGHGNRLWVRGQVVSAANAPTEHIPPGRTSHPHTSWWAWGASPPQAAAELELRVGGCQLSTSVVPGEDGRFECQLSADLPPSRRGWRVVRGRLKWSGTELEGCGLLLSPAHDPSPTDVIVLPLGVTATASGLGALGADFAGRGGAVPPSAGPTSSPVGGVYYLGCVGPDGPQPAELALSLATNGWPHGLIILLPRGGTPADVLAHGIHRLRWLLGEGASLRCRNLEPALKVDPAVPSSGLAGLTVISVERSEGTWGDREGIQGRTLRVIRESLVPHHPVVFLHGMLGYQLLRLRLPENHNSFAPVRHFFEERGCRSFFPQVTPTAGVEHRARELREQIRAWTSEPVNLIAHSMGGLDARFLISRLDMADRVRSLTTICTPHRGTYLADWFIANYGRKVPLLMTLQAVGANLDGFRDCQPAVCERFNRMTPDVAGVRYFSYTAAVPVSRLTPALRRGWYLLSQQEGPNDGIVSTASARWGEDLGTILADHFAQTPDAVVLRPEADFDPLEFCGRVVENLARRGL